MADQYQYLPSGEGNGASQMPGKLMFGVQSPASVIENLNVVFTKTDEDIQQMLDGHKVSIAQFMAASSYEQLQLLFERVNVCVYSRYSSVWLLLSMNHQNRNKFLAAVSCPQLENEFEIQNVSGLISWVKRHARDLPVRFERKGFSEKAEVFNISEVLWNKENAKVILRSKFQNLYNEVKKQKDLTAVMVLLEQKKIKYYATHIPLWNLLSMTQNERDQAFGQEYHGNATNFEKLQSMIGWLGNTRNQPAHRMSTPDVLQFMDKISAHVHNAKVQKIRVEEHSKLNIKKDGSLKVESGEFGPFELLHWLSEESRIIALQMIGLNWEHIKCVQNFDELETEFRYFSITLKESAQFYKRFWNLLTQNPTKQTTFLDQLGIACGSVFKLTNIGDLIHIMYQNKENIERYVEELCLAHPSDQSCADAKAAVQQARNAARPLELSYTPSHRTPRSNAQDIEFSLVDNGEAVKDEELCIYRLDQRPAGLTTNNFNQDSFSICLFQALVNCPVFMDDPICNSDKCVACCFRQLASWNKYPQVTSTVELDRCLEKYYTWWIEKDDFMMLSFRLNQIMNSCARIIGRKFKYKANTKVECLECNSMTLHQSDKNVFTLHLKSEDVGKTQTLQELIVENLREKPSSILVCQCAKGTVMEKTTLTHLPDVFIFSLYSVGETTKQKLCHHVTSSTYIELNGCEYKLFSVIIHLGSNLEECRFFNYTNVLDTWWRMEFAQALKVRKVGNACRACVWFYIKTALYKDKLTSIDQTVHDPNGNIIPKINLTNWKANVDFGLVARCCTKVLHIMKVMLSYDLLYKPLCQNNSSNLEDDIKKVLQKYNDLSGRYTLEDNPTTINTIIKLIVQYQRNRLTPPHDPLTNISSNNDYYLLEILFSCSQMSTFLPFEEVNTLKKGYKKFDEYMTMLKQFDKSSRRLVNREKAINCIREFHEHEYYAKLIHLGMYYLLIGVLRVTLENLYDFTTKCYPELNCPIALRNLGEMRAKIIHRTGHASFDGRMVSKQDFLDNYQQFVDWYDFNKYFPKNSQWMKDRSDVIVDYLDIYEAMIVHYNRLLDVIPKQRIELRQREAYVKETEKQLEKCEAELKKMKK